jgi:signal transduction histidine kinase
VLDRGIGIAEAEIEAVFDPFFRSASSAVGTSGAGLGLAVCRRLAEVQGGKMWAECREGGGAAIWLCLPRADAST